MNCAHSCCHTRLTRFHTLFRDAVCQRLVVSSLSSRDFLEEEKDCASLHSPCGRCYVCIDFFVYFELNSSWVCVINLSCPSPEGPCLVECGHVRRSPASCGEFRREPSWCRFFFPFPYPSVGVPSVSILCVSVCSL